MNFKNTGIKFLAAGMALMMLCGCGGTAENSIAETAAPTQESTEPPRQGKHHITIETVEISAADLEAQDYTVPVWITLDKNAGVTYAEWGAIVDDRCTFTAGDTKQPMALKVYHSINDAEHFLWTAWAYAGEPDESVGPIFLLDVKLPMSAKAGDFYTVNYADWSLADKAHIWSNNESDWVALDEVTWVDGGIKVVE